MLVKTNEMTYSPLLAIEKMEEISFEEGIENGSSNEKPNLMRNVKTTNLKHSSI